MGFFDQMKQLSELKSKMDEVKSKLNDIQICEQNDVLSITVNGHRKVVDIQIFNKELLNEKNLQEILNNALEKADAVIQKEMMGSLPNIPGL